MLTSSGDIRQPYETMNIVFGGFSQEGDFNYQEALNQMVAFAKMGGADGVIHIGFNERSAVGTKQVCFQNQTVTVFEVRCWGTMIKLS